MELRVPDYYGAFHCLAGDCPHSCCEGWSVVIDPVSAARYRALPGALGQRLRDALQTEDGEDFFALRQDGRCPFWDGNRLCEIHRALGADATSEVCRSHPRFVEDFGSLRETTLCASCAEACRLLLASAAPLTFPLSRTEEIGEAADPWLSPLLRCREQAFTILQDRTRPLAGRLAELLLFSCAAQDLLDADAAQDLPSLCGAWRVPSPIPLSAEAGIFPYGWKLLQSLEILGEDWATLLKQAERADGAKPPDWALERIAAYFLFRYFLKSINDGNLLGRVQFSIFSTLAAGHLAACVPLSEALRLYCREIEHDQENLDALLDAFQAAPPLSPTGFLAELQKHW